MTVNITRFKTTGKYYDSFELIIPNTENFDFAIECIGRTKFELETETDLIWLVNFDKNSDFPPKILF